LRGGIELAEHLTRGRAAGDDRRRLDHEAAHRGGVAHLAQQRRGAVLAGAVFFQRAPDFVLGEPIRQ
jgi:hypothetical protein